MPLLPRRLRSIQIAIVTGEHFPVTIKPGQQQVIPVVFTAVMKLIKSRLDSFPARHLPYRRYPHSSNLEVTFLIC